ncbi:MAG: Mur ligase domain-containing protein, partial [Treponema sp.]|nr:Mur ligase domain-containing protein [Treponema sp.]
MQDPEIFFSKKNCSGIHGKGALKTAHGLFRGLSFNSKTIKKNEIFIAVKGFNSDGIQFAQEAVNNGASAVICDKKSAIPKETLEFLRLKDIPLFKSKNPEVTAAKIARLFFPGQPEYVFAITGTNGKTTIADLTEQLLNHCGFLETATLGTMGFQTRNKKFKKLAKEINDILGINPLTTPDTITLHKILDMSHNAGVEYMVIEASSDGIMRSRVNEIDFSACGLSNVWEDHLITHGSMKNYIKAKFSLFSLLPGKKTAVFNNDNIHTKKLSGCISKNLSDKNLKIIRYGKISRNNEIQINEIAREKSAFRVKLKIYGKKYSAKINLSGEFQIYNAVNALGFVL